MEKLDVPQGTLDLMILTILAREPMHGYGISQRLAALSHDNFQVNPGSLFPSLYRLEQDGKLKAEWRPTENNRNAKYYRLTAVGAPAAGTASAALGPDRVRHHERVWRAHDAACIGSPRSCAGLFSRNRAEQGLDDELQAFIELSAADEDARRACRPRKRAAWRCSSSAASNRPRNASARIVTAPGSTRSDATCATPSACSSGIPASPSSSC